MRIIIPTKGRVKSQTTFTNLPVSLQANTIVVCPKAEVSRLRQNYMYINVMEQPDPEMGIAEKRKWIVEMSQDENIVMLDDDLRFCVRREDDPGLFRSAVPSDITKAFAELGGILSPDVPHAGFAARGGSIGDSAKKGGWQISGKRMMYVLGYHLPTVKEHVIFGRLGTHEDIDICLQLLTKGYPNAVNFSFLVDQKFGNPGGCSDERTVEKNNADCLKLTEFFPEYVKAKQKDYAGSTPRIEVVCQWQKALDDGFLNRE